MKVAEMFPILETGLCPTKVYGIRTPYSLRKIFSEFYLIFLSQEIHILPNLGDGGLY